jgi:protein-disulfide isomerase
LGAALLLLGVALPLDAQSLEGVDLSGVGYLRGEAGAVVTIVEFGDFACSACAQFHRDTWPRIERDLVATGRVRWHHVPFDLGFDRSGESANAAECAAEQGLFWPMLDRLFSGHGSWTRGRRPERVFEEYAAEIGADLDAFERCYDDESGEDRTKAASRAARAAGVRGTPTFFVNGRPAVGAIPFTMVLALVEEAENRRD